MQRHQCAVHGRCLFLCDAPRLLGSNCFVWSVHTQIRRAPDGQDTALRERDGVPAPALATEPSVVGSGSRRMGILGVYVKDGMALKNVSVVFKKRQDAARGAGFEGSSCRG